MVDEWISLLSRTNTYPSMAIYHILNGDCLADQLSQTSIIGECIICRECMIEGDWGVAHSFDFEEVRAKFMHKTYQIPIEEYFQKSVSEFEKMKRIPDGSEVCLWFENDLFCQTNMWYVLSLLEGRSGLTLYRIFPTIHYPVDQWKGFGISTHHMLEHAYASKVQFKPSDLQVGKKLWEAYLQADFEHLLEVAQSHSNCFQHLEEVCQAHCDRFPVDHSLGRPERMIKEIMKTKTLDFHEVFSEFTNRAGVYGFGDLQVKRIYDQQIHLR